MALSHAVYPRNPLALAEALQNRSRDTPESSQVSLRSRLEGSIPKISVFRNGDKKIGLSQTVSESEKRQARSGKQKMHVLEVNSAMMQAVPLPMKSVEEKNMTRVSEIQKLRLITAIKTPYLPDGRFDLNAYDTVVNRQIESGTEGLIVGGTTGEGHLMSWDEHIMLIAHTVNCFGDRIKVIGNTGSNSTREANHATEQGFAVGMHAALQINPYYGKTSMAGLKAHLSSVLEMGPTIIYNVPARTGQDIPPPVMQSLAESPNFAGVKECVGNERVGQYTGGGLTVWSGNDDQCHDARWDFGARGVISVVSNLVPGLAREMLFEARNPELNAKLMPLIDWLFTEPNPTGLNTAFAQLGLARPVFRLPYLPYDIELRREFVRIVDTIGIQHFCGAKSVQVLEDSDFSVLGRF